MGPQDESALRYPLSPVQANHPADCSPPPLELPVGIKGENLAAAETAPAVGPPTISRLQSSAAESEGAEPDSPLGEGRLSVVTPTLPLLEGASHGPPATSEGEEDASVATTPLELSTPVDGSDRWDLRDASPSPDNAPESVGGGLDPLPDRGSPDGTGAKAEADETAGVAGGEGGELQEGDAILALLSLQRVASNDASIAPWDEDASGTESLHRSDGIGASPGSKRSRSGTPILREHERFPLVDRHRRQRHSPSGAAGGERGAGGYADALRSGGYTDELRYFCKYPECGKGYASTDAVRKHCRQRHLEWLRRLGHGCPALYCSWGEQP